MRSSSPHQASSSRHRVARSGAAHAEHCLNRAQVKAHPRPVWQQQLQLSLSTLPNRIRRIVGSAKDWAYSLYTRGIFYILAAFTYLSVMLLPTTFPLGPLMRAMARLLAKASGTTTDTTRSRVSPHRHSARHPGRQPLAVISTALPLVALLPFSFRFVAKSELRRNWIAHTFLKRINTLFVERSDPRQAVTDSYTAQRSALQGESQCYFPEGTFSRRPGLLPFHMGAFSTAAKRRSASAAHYNPWHPFYPACQRLVHPSQPD